MAEVEGGSALSLLVSRSSWRLVTRQQVAGTRTIWYMVQYSDHRVRGTVLGLYRIRTVFVTTMKVEQRRKRFKGLGCEFVT